MDSVQLLRKRYHTVSILLSVLLGATLVFRYFSIAQQELIVLVLGIICLAIGAVQLVRKVKK